MQHLKKEIQSRNIYHILTYADNQAIGYFMKQGFHKHVTFPNEKWRGYIKDYVEATLMECVLHKNVEDYTDVPSTIAKQREALMELIGRVSKSDIQPGITIFKEQGVRHIKIDEIPGLKEAGWKHDSH